MQNLRKEIAMKLKKILQMLGILLLITASAPAENIDPYDANNQYAWGENVGWLNFEPDTGDGVQVGSYTLTGFIWAENIGWISLSCENTSSCGTVNYGVTNDGSGNLSGYAWAENVGWISFSCANTGSCGAVSYGVTIDANGNFGGQAWGENIGWINFGLVDYQVVACKVTFEDLANFVDDWLDGGAIPGNLNLAGDVDFEDYSIFASYWKNYCPDQWPLK
jgi:hypothetical protein